MAIGKGRRAERKEERRGVTKAGIVETPWLWFGFDASARAMAKGQLHGRSCCRQRLGLRCYIMALACSPFLMFPSLSRFAALFQSSVVYRLIT